MLILSLEGDLILKELKMHDHIKFSRIISNSVLLLLVVALVGYQPADAKNDQQRVKGLFLNEVQAIQPSIEVYLPVVNKDFPAPHILRSPFSVAIPALHQVTEPQGVSGLSTTAEAFPTLLDAFKETGATGTRIEVNWSVIEPEKPDNFYEPNYNWSFYDQRLGWIADSGIQMIVAILASNTWAADPACGPFVEDGLDHFDRFVTDLVTRYKAPPYNVRFWEVFNEPDGIRPFAHLIGQACWGNHGSEYKEVLSRIYTTIKSVDPSATVMFGGIAHDWFTENEDGVFNRYFLDDVMAVGGGDFTDALNFHYFTDFRLEWERWDPNDPGIMIAPTCGDVYDEQGLEYFAGGIDVIAKGNHIRNRMAVCFSVDKPLFLTETARRSDVDPESMQEKARYVPKVYARSLSIDMKNITWYGITTPNQPDGQGLLDDDFVPRPAFYAYKTMTTELSGYQFHAYLKPIDLYTDLEGYYFQNSGGGLKLVVWKGDYHESPIAPLVVSPASQIRVVDYLGNTSIIFDGGPGDLDGQVNGAILLHVDENPIYIEVLTQ
jgi:hypothetical protein